MEYIGVEGMITVSVQSSSRHSAISVHLLHSFQADRGCYWPHPFLLIILLLAGSVLASQNASAILDGGLGLSADQLIDASRGDYILDLGIAATPQQSRDIWESESGINFSKTETIAESSGTPQSSRSASEKLQNSADISSSADESGREGTLAASVASSQPASGSTAVSSQSGSPAENAAGNWTFRLTDDKIAILALNLYQSDGVLFGSGSMNDGGDSLKSQASGWIEGSNLSLDVTTSGDVRLYRLSLSARPASEEKISDAGPTAVWGSFRAYAAGGASWTGTAEGDKRN